jgi:hypothetical protein
MENTGDKPSTARAAAPIEFLGLEIRGNAESRADQELIVAANAVLTGRNEIRISDHAILTLDGGGLSSLRWVDVRNGGTLRGAGSIDASLDNAGTVAATGRLDVRGDYCEQTGADLVVTLRKADRDGVLVHGDAHLAGKLSITLAEGVRPEAGDAMTILQADRLTGTFVNEDEQVVSSDGTRFAIQYSEAGVKIVAQ